MVHGILLNVDGRIGLRPEPLGMVVTMHAAGRFIDRTSGTADPLAAIMAAHDALVALQPVDGSKVLRLSDITLPAADGAFLATTMRMRGGEAPIAVCRTWVSRDQLHTRQAAHLRAWSDYLAGRSMNAGCDPRRKRPGLDDIKGTILMSGTNLRIAITADDKATSQIDAINKRIAAIQAPVDRAQKSLAKFADQTGIAKLARGMENVAHQSLNAFENMGRMAGPLGTITGAATIAGMVALSRTWADMGRNLGLASLRLARRARTCRSCRAHSAWPACRARP